MSVQKFTYEHSGLAPHSLREAGVLLVRLASPIADAVAAVGRWHKRRQAQAELMALDDRLLQDIGLSRGRIDATVAGSSRRNDAIDLELR